MQSPAMKFVRQHVSMGDGSKGNEPSSEATVSFRWTSVADSRRITMPMTLPDKSPDMECQSNLFIKASQARRNCAHPDADPQLETIAVA